MKYPRLARITMLFCLLIASAFMPSAVNSSSPGQPTAMSVKSAAAGAARPAARDALAALQNTAKTEVITQLSRQTGVYTFVRSEQGEPIAVDDASATPQRRALAFLATHGGLVGMTGAERSALNAGTVPAGGSELRVVKTERDSIGMQQVRFDQFYKGLRVFGGQLVVHMSDKGIRAVNGNYVPEIALSAIPAVNESAAREIAITSSRKKAGGGDVKAEKAELAIYPLGLLEGAAVQSRLAYAVEISSPAAREQIWIDAQSGSILNRISLRHTALNRVVYAPMYDPSDPEANVIRREGDPTILPPPSNPPDNLYHYTGHSYNLFASAFGRDSYDAKGITMRTVLLVNEVCPNAYWDGQTTNYCPDFDKDDIVAHEWGHAYTEYTHNLIYSYQSGALNESYSDIWGETIDLNNGVDGAGGMNNSQPTTYTIQNGQYVPTPPDPLNGVRWRIGEDLTGLSQPVVLGISRDMWTPLAYGDPDKVSSPNYHCDASDGGGVHTNSGVPNHAYVMLVDGKTFNGVTVGKIGFVRAMNIYYRAMTSYQTPTTNFAQHEQALQASCRDLIGASLTNFSTSSAARSPSPDVITQDTCVQVANAMAAVEMSRDVFAQCNFQKLLDPNTPPQCAGSSTFFSENWETGTDGWTFGNQGTGDAWPGTNWTPKSDLPPNLDGSEHSGTAIFAINPRIGEPNGGTCQPGGDVTGHFWIDSPAITIPAGVTDPKLAFDHYVQTELEFDGGNVKISVNGGAFTAIPDNQFAFNPPNFTAPSGTPLAGERIWNGTNEGELNGSWGTTIVNLANLAKPGDVIVLRFDFAQDGCNGNLGWFVDTVRLFNCPVFEAPVLSAGADYESPDTNGSYTLTWTRPVGATGPDTLQESTTCGPVFVDDASEPLVGGSNSRWSGNPQWSSQPNPDDGGNIAYYIPDGAAQDTSLTMVQAIPIPAGASAALTFTTRQGIETDFDFGRVEISTDNGATFAEVAAYTGPDALDPVTVFVGARSIDISQFAGQSIKVRFRFTSDAFNIGQQAGWHIDNIAVTASAFSDVATVSGTSFTVSGRGTGNYCYRVRTSYPVAGQTAQGPFSNLVGITVAPGVLPAPARLQNISTRGRVLTGDGVMIGGFIITGNTPKSFIARAMGPSLTSGGAPIQGRMMDPVLELHGPNGFITSNDNWKDSQPADIAATGIPPGDDRESAITGNLDAGAYTLVLRGKNDEIGIAVVELYDLNSGAASTLANLSTRGFVQTADNVLIGGVIAGPDNRSSTSILIRGLGPSVPVGPNLANPTLQFVDGNGATIDENDNWRESQEAEIAATGIPPQNEFEAAIFVPTLAPGRYTAILRGANNTVGHGLVEIYNLR